MTDEVENMNVTAASKPHFILLGANLDTGNMGVNALLVSTVTCILEDFPDATVYLFAGKREAMNLDLTLGNGKKVRLGCLGIRHNKTVWRPNHIVRLLLGALLIRLVPGARRRRALYERDRILSLIVSARGVADITGGDSFSDIYGIWRLFVGTLNKALILLSGQGLVLLPQTYGPYGSACARALARWTLSRSERVFSRDQDSLAVIAELMGKRKMKAEPRFAYDMAFVLEAVPPAATITDPPGFERKDGTLLVGLNVSGLLYNGGYNRKNMFGLALDYPALVRNVIDRILERPDAVIILVPHVFVRPGGVESDPDACALLYAEFEGRYPGRIYNLRGNYDQSELKYVIGQCDFFLGSRMHACIAALSQGIPAVALAYSRKFAGVYDTIGQGDLVLDMVAGCDCLDRIDALLDNRSRIAARLVTAMPEVKRSVRSTVRKSFQSNPDGEKE